MKRKIKPVEGKQKTYEIDIKKHQTLYKNFLNLIPDIMEDPKLFHALWESQINQMTTNLE